MQWLLKKFYLENAMITSVGLKTLPVPIAFILWGNLWYPTITVSQSYFVFFSNIAQGVTLLLVMSLIRRYDKIKYNYPNSTKSYGVPTMCPALWMDTLSFTVRAPNMLQLQFLCRPHLLHNNALLLQRAAITVLLSICKHSQIWDSTPFISCPNSISLLYFDCRRLETLIGK